MSGLALALAILFTVIAQVSYKLFYLKKKKLFLFSSIVFFVTTHAMVYFALKGLPLSTVYMTACLNYVLVVLLAYLLLGEAISKGKIQAMCLIVGGVIVFNL